MKRHARCLAALISLMFFLVINPSVSLTALLDKGSKKYEVVDSVVTDLDKEGIDVARKLNSKQAQKNRKGQPVLGSLSGLKVRKDASSNEATWAAEFKNGTIGGIAGVKSDSGAPSTSLDAFRQKWQSADVSKRVFISFVGVDLQHAMKVKLALEKQGYVTFVFMQDVSKGPLTSPQEAGRFFKEAGHRLVIDTAEARKSAGVIFEYRLNESLAGKESKGSPTKPKPGDSGNAKAKPTRSGNGNAKAKPASSETYRKCAYCGNKAVGYCHIRHKRVCEQHRYFTDSSGTHWRCP